jgi:hypothetical protein
MDNSLGPEEVNCTCGKMMHRGTRDRGFTYMYEACTGSSSTARTLLPLKSRDMQMIIGCGLVDCRDGVAVFDGVLTCSVAK